MADDALVDDTTLFLLSNQRELEQRQLSAPGFVPTKAPSTADKPNSVTNETNASSAISAVPHRSVQVTPLSRCSQRQSLRYRPLNKCAMNKNVMHRFKSGSNITKLSSSQFAPQLTECENGTPVWADVTVNYTRILVPTSLRRSIFDSLHSLSHPGVKAGVALLKRVYWWSGIGKDVSK